MEFKLVRDFNKKKDKEQEEEFAKTSNIKLFFSLEKILYGIDEWSFSNIKKLASQKPTHEITLTFQKWNTNIEYLYKHLNLTDSFMFKEVPIKIKDCIANNDATLFSVLLKELNNQQKIEICLYLLSLLGDDKNSFELVNKAMNTKLVNLNKILNLLFFKYVIGRLN